MAGLLLSGLAAALDRGRMADTDAATPDSASPAAQGPDGLGKHPPGAA